ncbi:MAG TPA: SelT/SelW/SelH family protein [Bauldia sp.]|nr:SelT/SelW/SelH family protein [Bauldia sp.]
MRFTLSQCGQTTWRACSFMAEPHPFLRWCSPKRGSIWAHRTFDEVHGTGPLSLPTVEIEYCRQCRWLLRAAWTAQELLTTFEDEIGAVTLKPGTGGVFRISVDGTTVWSRKQAGRHVEIAELKQLVRDMIAPGRSLGHSDRKRTAGEAKGA